MNRTRFVWSVHKPGLRDRAGVSHRHGFLPLAWQQNPANDEFAIDTVNLLYARGMTQLIEPEPPPTTQILIGRSVSFKNESTSVFRLMRIQVPKLSGGGSRFTFLSC
jgi:hypothetical protein